MSEMVRESRKERAMKIPNVHKIREYSSKRSPIQKRFGCFEGSDDRRQEVLQWRKDTGQQKRDPTRRVDELESVNIGFFCCVEFVDYLFPL